MIALKRPTVFLDRDGVLNVDKGYTYKVEDLELLPGVGESLKKLQDIGFLLIVVSNQSGVARGYYTEDDVKAFHAAMDKHLSDVFGVHIDAFYFCPHYFEGAEAAYVLDCDCRKPKTGLIKQACADYVIDLEKSFLIGDKDSDMGCAHNAGVYGIRVDPSEHSSVKSLVEGVDIILKQLRI